MDKASSKRPPPAANPEEEARLLEEQCPGLAGADYRVTSASTKTYNCVAWSVDDFERCWSPMPGIPSAIGGAIEPIGGYHWPKDLPALMGIETLKELFRRRGFSACETTNPEDGVEKVAIYGDEIICTHVAVQRLGEPWTSKMGDRADIEHTQAAAIECGLVGQIQAVLRRATNPASASAVSEPAKPRLALGRSWRRQRPR